MSTISVQVSSSSDDAYEESGTITLNGLSFNVDDGVKYGFDRWTGLGVLDGATINSAVASYKIVDGNGDEPDVTFWGDDRDSPPTATSASNDIGSRTPTSASIAWSDTNLGVGAAAFVEAPAFTAIIAELVASGFLAGGIVAIFYSSTNDITSRDFNRLTYDNDPADAAILEVDYTAGGGGYDDDILFHHTTTGGAGNAGFMPPGIAHYGVVGY